jgi:hypothetical protein
MMDNFMHWVTLTIFSLVSLTSLTNDFEPLGDWSKNQRWVMSVAAMSLGMSVIAIFFLLFMREMFSGKKMELVWILVVLGFWCAGLPALMDFENNFAVNLPDGRVLNANLFFSSWGSFTWSMLLLSNHLQVMWNKQDHKHMFHWVGFATSGLVVLSYSTLIWQDLCEDVIDDNTCDRTFFGLVLGAVSGFFGYLMVVFELPLMWERWLSIMFLAAWSVGVAYLTFDSGPATNTGSLFFGVWLAFLFILQIAVPTIQSMVDSMMGNTDDAPIEMSKDVNAKDSDDKEEEEVA